MQNIIISNNILKVEEFPLFVTWETIIRVMESADFNVLQFRRTIMKSNIYWESAGKVMAITKSVQILKKIYKPTMPVLVVIVPLTCDTQGIHFVCICIW